jgi:DNA polymerase-3 subunit gamma/tau
MNIANQCDISYKLSKNQRLQVELALLKMCHLPSVFNLAAMPMSENAAAPNGEVKKKPDTSVNSTPPAANVADEMTVARDNPVTYNKPATQVTPPVKQCLLLMRSRSQPPRNQKVL